MYIAIQVQSTKEQLAIKNIQAVFSAFGEEVTLHLLEQANTKQVGKKLKETKENIIPSYIIAELKDGLASKLYHLLSTSGGVIRVLHQKPVSEAEFQHLKDQVSQGKVTIKEPKIPNCRKNNTMLNKLEHALTTPGISQKAIARLKVYLAKIREQHRQYRAYIRNISSLSSYRVFTGRNYVLEFPIEALVAARRRLFSVPFGWNDPMQLALRLAISEGVKIE